MLLEYSQFTKTKYLKNIMDKNILNATVINAQTDHFKFKFINVNLTAR